MCRVDAHRRVPRLHYAKPIALESSNPSNATDT